MPLLSPIQINSVLEEAGLSADTVTDLSVLLRKHNLTPDDTLQILSDIAYGGDSSSIRLRAVETATKINGLVSRDEGINIPIVNIIINGSINEINPILIPRESL